MNIFYLDHNPKTSALWMIDAHQSKMIVESVQMLANAYSLERLAKPDCPRNQKGKPRTYGYRNHPCTIWSRESLSNFNWLLDHANYLYEEKIYRLGGDHFCIDFIRWCQKNTPDIKDIGLTTPALAFKNYPHLRDFNNPTESYQKFYCEDKRYNNAGKWMVKYTKRPIPDFWGQYLNDSQLDEFIKRMIE